MNRADRMYRVLRDGREHSRREILAEAWRSGGFFLTNNAASELRQRGLTVEQYQRDGEHFYRLNAPDATHTLPPCSRDNGGPASGALSWQDTPNRAATAHTTTPPTDDAVHQLSLLGTAA